MKVLKFGGSSVATAESIKKVVDLLVDRLQKKEQLYIVFSALGGVTDKLIRLSKIALEGSSSYPEELDALKDRHLNIIEQLMSVERSNQVIANFFRVWDELQSLLYGISLVKECTKRTLDCITSFGERLSAYIITQIIKEKYLDIDFIDARKLIITDDSFGQARVDFSITNERIQEHAATHLGSHVVTGFIASTMQGETITLGRGGSDYTAAIFAAVLQAEAVEIWTDVDGVMTADPRKVQQAFPIAEMTFNEAMEISHFGAKVIHPPTIQPVLVENIPVLIKNTFNPEATGTWIKKNIEGEQPLIKGISTMSHIALLRIQGSGMIGISGVSSRLFQALAKHQINVILISQASSEHTICLAIHEDHAHKAKFAIEEEFKLEIYACQVEKIILEKEKSIVAIVGEKMRHRSGVSERLFTALGQNGVNIVAIAQGSSELNISAVIDSKDEEKALNAVHERFFLSETTTLNLFFLGLGLVGNTLLNQLEDRSTFLKEKHHLTINLVAVGNSRTMLFKEPSIDFKQAKSLLEEHIEAMDLSSFIEKTRRLNLSNSVFVDCTATEEVAQYYPELLKNKIAIVTPNKKANTQSQQFYSTLKELEKRKGTRFYYETNVGAGLPVISTLRDLIDSGDEILKIEAVLSGTLSYIFNTYNGEQKFSEVVQQAKERGFTEPDPRDDLNGMDVGRKILILARETGIAIELEDIYIENLVDEACMKASTIEGFFEALSKMDDTFASRFEQAKKAGKRLCYVGNYENGKGSVSLQFIDSSHPFFSLQGSDNMIVFKTKRYREHPLVIRGPGAGAEVTAGGVFADIMRVFHG